MTTPVKLKLLPRSTMKAKVATRLVGQVAAGNGILVTKAAGNFTVAVDPAGSVFQLADADLTALAANSTNGFWAHTGAGTGAARSLTAPAAGFTITNPAGVAGDPTFVLANDLLALENMSGTGLVVRTAAESYAQRTLTGTAAEITVTNGDGISGAPTFSLPSALTFTGKTVTGGTFSGPTISGGTIDNTPIGGTTKAAGAFTTLGIGAAAPSSTTQPVQITTATAAAQIGQTNSASVWVFGPSTALGATGKGWGLFSSTLANWALQFDDSNVATLGYATLSGGVLKLQNSGGTATLTPTATATFTLPNASGTVAVSASSPLVLNATTGNLTLGVILAANFPALTGDITTPSGSLATTLATVNANVGTFGSATQSVQFTVNAKGLVTAAANVTVTPAVGSITGLGTGVATALGIAIGSAGAPVTFNGAGGTPSSLTLTNATALPIAGLTASTSTALGVGSIELGHASDTTVSRSSAGVIAVEGVTVPLNSITNIHTAQQIELGHASDTTITRVSAGVVAVEGVNVLLNGGAGGTPSSINLTNATSLPTSALPTGIGFRAHRNGVNQTGIADATATTLQFDTEVFDQGNYYNTGTYTWTPPAGTVILATKIAISGTQSTNKYGIVYILKNGTIISNSATLQTFANQQIHLTSTVIDTANGTDAYTVQAYLDVDSGTATLDGTALSSYFSGAVMH